MKRFFCCIAILLVSASLWGQSYKAKHDENYKYGYINDAGTWVIPPQFDYSSDFKNGFGEVTVNDKDGLIDAKGKLIIPCEWDDINTYYLEKGVIIVEKDKRYGLMDGKGKLLIKCEWDDVNCTNAEKDSIVVDRGNMSGAFDRKGKQILPCKFDKGFMKNQWGYYDVSVNKKRGLYDGTGKELIPCKYDDVDYYPDERGFVSVTLNGKKGLCDTAGSEVIPCEYSSIFFDDSDTQAYCVNNKKGEVNLYGIYTKAGKLLFPCKYTVLSLISGKYYWTQLDGKDVYYDLTGKEIGDPNGLADETPEEKGVELSGTWSFNVDNSAKVTSLTGDKIENKSSTSDTGNLKIRLFLTNAKYSGGDITGYIAFEAYFDPLKNGYYYYDIDKRYEFNAIPDGTYYATLCLLEDDGGYSIVDYLNFDNLISIDNSAERLQRFTDALNQTANALNALSNPGNSYVPSPSPGVTAPTPGSTLHKVSEKCSFCHGTGKNPGKEYPPSFGLEKTYDKPPCEICGDRDNHYHKKCPSCNGKGYVEKFKR